MKGIGARILLTVSLCMTLAGILWAVSLVASPVVTAPDAVPSQAAYLSAPLPPVAELRLPTTPVQPQDGVPAQLGPTQPEPAPDPLAQWAAETAPLLGIPEPALIGYGAGELAMQDKAPGCRLSWITLAALGHVGSERVRPQDGAPAALATAERLCAGGRDTGTGAGWASAVRSVGGGTAYVHRVLAVATTYATVVRSGTPISPHARAAIDFAINQIGLPYVWGGNGPHRGDAGFDCSGLTAAAYATAGVSLPRTAHTQFFTTRHVTAEHVQPGDLVFYGNPSTKIHHVGLYIGNGQMINAPTFGMPVQVASVLSGGSYAGAGRPAG